MSAARRPSALLVDSKAMHGGGQRMLALLAQALAGWRVGVVRPPAAVDPPAAFAGLPVVRLSFPDYPAGLSRPLAQLRASGPVARCCFALLDELRRSRPDVVVANDLYALIPLLPACRLLRIPLLFYVHGCDLPRGRMPGLLVRGCAGAIACCAAAGAALPALPRRLWIVPNAVPARAAGGDAGWRDGWSDRWVFGFVGRIDANKNLGGLLEAFAACVGALDAAGAPAACLVAGSGPLAAEAGRLAADPRLAGRVRFLGEVADGASLIAGLDALVLPSRSEAAPLVISEAQLAGVPVLATRCGGIPELVEDGATGVLAASPAPADLAAGLLRLRRIGRGDALVLRALAAARQRADLGAYATAMRGVLESFLPGDAGRRA
jgi:glycosyltransferase involved in cell wall biosynthesis